MWLSEKLSNLLSLNVDAARACREELSAVRAERDLLKVQLAVAQNNFEWTRSRCNSLELERAGLMEKAYNIKLPAPEIVRTQRDITPGQFQLANLFDSFPLDDSEDSNA